MSTNRRKKRNGRRESVLLYHDMRVHENFEQCATRLVSILKSAQERSPGGRRVLHLDVQGHRNSAGSYDRDAFEIMNNLLLPDDIIITDPENRPAPPRDENPDPRRSKPSLRAIADYLGLDTPCCMICWDTPVERAHARPASLVGSNDVRNFALLCRKHHRMAPDVEDSEAFWRWMDWALEIDGFFAALEPGRTPIGDDFSDDIDRQLQELHGWSREEIQLFDWVEVMRLQYQILDKRTSKHFGVDRKASTYAWALDQALRELRAREDH